MLIPRHKQHAYEIPLADIRSSTDNFSTECQIGEGGFGKVFKAAMGDVLVAVKLLNGERNGESLTRKGFLRELEALTKLRHRHIVSLIGCCSEEGEMILVYEYIANGTLADHLHGKARDRHSLTWTERLHICIGVCLGLDHLHNTCPDNSIIHGDVKSSNILLDEDLVAKVSDFGSAKQITADRSPQSSGGGTTGFTFSPGYALDTGIFTMASDVYAFGVVLLEVLSERRAHHEIGPRKEILSNWAVGKIHDDKRCEIVASSLSKEISKKSRNCFLSVAERCLHKQPEERPNMSEVLTQLKEALRLQQEKPKTFWPIASPKQPMPSGLEQDNAIQEDAIEHEQMVRNIPLAELKEITKGFSSKCLIDKRSTRGSLFRGVLKTGQDAAIQKLNIKLPGREFQAQVSKISGLQHDNVVRLLGYCVNGDQQLLAFEFAPCGSLHDILHGKKVESSTVVPWVQRINIAVGAAEGLNYIHENGLIHHSIKSRNILLFEDGNAKLCDVSLSTPCPCKAAWGRKRYPDQAPCGCCYHPPECASTNRTQEGDVYSFGVVLLEILTGHKPTQPRVEEFLQMPLIEDEIRKVVDARLGTDYPLSALAMMAEVAAECLAKDAGYRPDMTTVLKYLNRALWETNNRTKKSKQQPRGRKKRLWQILPEYNAENIFNRKEDDDSTM